MSSVSSETSSVFSDASSSASSHPLGEMVKEESIEQIVQNASFEDPALQERFESALEAARQAALFYDQQSILDSVAIDGLITEETINQIEEAVNEAREARARETAERILQGQTQRTLEIRGHFYHTGEGQWDWIYVTQNGQGFKLDGVDPQTGNFKYVPVDNPQDLIPSGTKGLPFAKYGDATQNGFDWVIASGGRLFKLEGYDFETEKFIYSPVSVQVQTNGDALIVMPGQ
jgi:hypothetical protein